MDESALQHYTQRFAKLRTASGVKSFSAATRHRAPHKPLLLLSVIDLIEQGHFQTNLITLDPELRETFITYWLLTPRGATKPDISYPFNHLASDGFWELLPNPNSPKTPTLLKSPSIDLLTKTYLGAKLDDELFALLQFPIARDKLRLVIVKTYFSDSLQYDLIKQAKINLESYQYSLTLINPIDIKSIKEVQSKYSVQARDAGFRKVVVSNYDHRCAFCGIRMVTPEFHTVIEAAHIVPWATSQNDHPTNGIALCRLCHWAFDEGLFSVSMVYKIMASRRLMQPPNNPGSLSTQADREMLKPNQQNHWPDLDALAWHRENIFYS